MKVAFSPNSVRRVFFCYLAGLCFVFMMVLPVAARSSSGSAIVSADQASSTTKDQKPAKKTKKQAKADKKAAKSAISAEEEAAKPVGKAGKKAKKPTAPAEEEAAKPTSRVDKKAAKKTSSSKGEKVAKPASQAEEQADKPMSKAGKKAAKPTSQETEEAAKPVVKAGKKAKKPAAPAEEEAVAKPAGKVGKKSKNQADKNAAKDTSGTDEEIARPTGKADKKALKLAAKPGKKSKKHVSRASKAAQKAQTARIKLAFQASAELRPMAQQLAALRTSAAYAGVTKYAHEHTGDAASAAYLALGHAALLDRHYAEAVANFRQSLQAGGELADYADFLGARANHEAGNDAAAEELLHGFAQRYPDSIFISEAPELEANVLLGMKDTAGARQVLAAASDTEAASRPGYQLAEGEVLFALGETAAAESLYKRLLMTHPLSSEAGIARAKLTTMGATLTMAELRSLGDAYYKAGHYEDASEQYRALIRQTSLDDESRNGFAVAVAACDLKLKRLTTAEATALADTPDENGARRLYLLMELARNRNDLDEQKRIVTEMESRFPQSSWLAEALLSSGNMYLLRHEYAQATVYYSALATSFPSGKNASAAHWKAGWLSYRQGLYADAARLFDEQIQLYPGTTEAASALYWRGRLYETQEHNPARAAANYRTVIRAYQHYFYAQMARKRLAALDATQAGAQETAQPVSAPQLDRFQAPQVPVLMEDFPTDSPHLAKAHLLANAGLNDYIAEEIAADPDSSSWSALAEAQIYTSYGETFRALRSLKRALPYSASAPIPAIPLAYWRILYPQPWWETIKAEAAKNNVDPYLVASLIRQESEFNPSAVSRANAYGLMQVLPPEGRELARQEGMSHFETFQLLDPATNIRLGTRYLRQTLDKFGGVTEYALAAYNAGGSRVVDWQAAGPYQGIDEFVESIPFTETRGYVESILRNMEMYRAIDDYASSHGKPVAGTSR
jgi:soluble lytic murein transglycosylase